MGIISNKGIAQVVLSLSYSTQSGTPTSVQSGEYWDMQLNYSISSTTGSATGVKITIPVPDYIVNVIGLTGTTHAPLSNFSFTSTPGAKKLTINFISPVSSGSSGVLTFKMRTLNGATPNGTVINTCATMTDNLGNTSGSPCSNMTITAQQKFCGQKILQSGGAIGYPVTYRVALLSNFTYNYSVPNGSLNATNISITDTYPAGASFISARVVNENGTSVASTIIPGANSVTATIPDYIITNKSGTNPDEWFVSPMYLEVTVQYNSPTFNTTTPITNTASITFTPLGGSPITINNGDSTPACTSDLIETHTLSPPIITANLTKAVDGSATPSTVYSGMNVVYNLNFTNTGNTPLENVELIETVPTEYTIAGLRLDALGYQILSLQYQTNLNTTWTAWNTPNAYISPPTLSSGEKITKIKFILASPYNAGTAFRGYNQMTFTTTNVSSPTSVVNCIEWNSTTANIPTNRTTCSPAVTINPQQTTAKLYYTATHLPGCTALSIGQTIKVTGTLQSQSGYAATQNPKAAFLIPAGFSYITGSTTFVANNSGITVAPTLDIINNYVTISGVVYNLYRWQFPSGTVLPVNTSFSVTADFILTNKIPGGVVQTLRFMAEGSNVTTYQPDTNLPIPFTDTNDWDTDGNTTEVFNTVSTSYKSCNLSVTSSASMESLKWVKGLCDSLYSRYPAYGQTVPGGNADYQLIVKNTGNIAMKNIQIIDILPYIGDKGVIDPQPRNTEWRPNLAGPIAAPSGIAVYYSTVSNPCRDEVKQPSDPSPYPTGCTPPNWSSTAPSDITKVQSVKIDFGSTVLLGGDSLIFSWPMRAPVNAPTNNEIAWNSFAFVATRNDNNTPLLAAEPIKVGIKVKPGAPAFYGNRVWYDTNHDGIQDANEGGVDGIKVKLFKVPTLATTPNPVSDEFINFTVTGNGGYYRFSNLQPGFYYAVFCLPTGYGISPKNTTINSNDSDGSTTTYDGEPATITVVTELVADEDDDTWDQGIYCSFIPTVTPIQNVAENSSVTLTASGGNTYLWSGPNGFSASTASITINPVTPADTGTYIVNIEIGACRASLTTGISMKGCTPPNAGSDLTICLPKTTLNLTDAPSGTQWVAGTGNPATATINATTGVITGLTVVGTYTFSLQTIADATCKDDMQVIVTNGETPIPLCNDGSTSYTLIAPANLTSVIWYNMAGVQVGTGNSFVVTSNINGLADGSEAFYYQGVDGSASGCDIELCCPVKFITQNCCPVPNCATITIIKN